MVFWAGILAGGLFAWLAVKMGFYWTCTTLFNIVISVYLAIFLGPIITDFIPGAAGTAYSHVLGMISIGIGAFLILHCLSCAFLAGYFRVSFPRIIDSLGSALLGFLAGFLVWSFVGLLISITPIAQSEFVKEVGFGGQSQQTNLSNVGWWCDLVHRAVGSKGSEVTSKEIIAELLRSTERKRRHRAHREADPNKVAEADANRPPEAGTEAE
ncbi:MAG: CvpA family protein [Planctomycetota bacterium]|jgi:uncharacterized membrane protein required for colicin V production